MARIGEVTGVAPVDLPVYDSDAAYLEAWRLDVLAKHALQVADAVETPVTPDFTDEDLLNLAIALAMNPPADVKRADLVQLLRAEVTPEADVTDTTEVAPVTSPYAALTKAELQALTDKRELVVVGTGAQGNVLVSDLQAALTAWDEAQATGAGDEEGKA